MDQSSEKVDWIWKEEYKQQILSTVSPTQGSPYLQGDKGTQPCRWAGACRLSSLAGGTASWLSGASGAAGCFHRGASLTSTVCCSSGSSRLCCGEHFQKEGVLGETMGFVENWTTNYGVTISLSLTVFFYVPFEPEKYFSGKLYISTWRVFYNFWPYHYLPVS